MKKYQSQNNETQIVIDYFKGEKGTVLEIGANDGKTLSNSYDLINMGWNAVLVEPSNVYEELYSLYDDNHHVACCRVAIGSKSGKMTLHESGSHVPNGNDKALVSTLVKEETKRWKDVKFKKVEVDVLTFEDLLHTLNIKEKAKFDYISIDVEGFEMEILPQIDLKRVGCKILCIEWNGNKTLRKEFTDYCAKYGMKEIHKNAENLIFAIP